VGAVDERIVTAASAVDLQYSVEQFLFREARLMDELAYDAWLNLWTEECTYWVPCNANDADPRSEVSIVYAGRKQLEDRVWRLSGLHAHAQRPASRITHILSNIELERVDDAEIAVQSAFMLCEVRKDEMHFWAGRNVHVLARTGDGLRIKSKKVMLVNNNTTMPNLTFII
jgi:benzoate/toluate 1,2-dioxygenase beta subunit